MHLCDISVKNQISFSEGDTIEPGSQLSVFQTPYATVSRINASLELQYAMTFVSLRSTRL